MRNIISSKADTSRLYDEKAVSPELPYLLNSESLFGSHFRGGEQQKILTAHVLEDLIAHTIPEVVFKRSRPYNRISTSNNQRLWSAFERKHVEIELVKNI